MKKRLIFLIIITLMFTLLYGCAGKTYEVVKPSQSADAQSYNITGECKATLNDNILYVTGTNNIIDNTNGVITILNSNGSVADEKKFKLENGSVEVDFEVKDDWTDTVYALIAFSTQQGDKQPRDVTDVYGKKFENMTGENIIWDLKGVIAIFQSDVVEIR